MTNWSLYSVGGVVCCGEVLRVRCRCVLFCVFWYGEMWSVVNMMCYSVVKFGVVCWCDVEICARM